MMKILSKLIFVLLYMCIAIQHINGEVQFGQVTTVSTLYNLFPSQLGVTVWVIQEDVRKPGNIIVGTDYALFTIPLAEDSTDGQLIVGNQTRYGYAEGIGEQALFGDIEGLVQMTNKYIVSDYGNHCLREIIPVIENNEDEKQKWRTLTFAGKCQQNGDVIGSRNDARFHTPQKLVQSGHFLYIADSVNAKIKQLNLDTDQITTAVHVSKSTWLSAFVLGKEEGEFYITANHGVLHIQHQTESWLLGSSSKDYTSREGSFNDVGFAYPEDIEWLDNITLLIADKETHTGRVADLNSRMVTAICPRTSGYKDGDVDDCRLYYPKCLHVANGKIIIGESPSKGGGLRQITYGKACTKPGKPCLCSEKGKKACKGVANSYCDKDTNTCECAKNYYPDGKSCKKINGIHKICFKKCMIITNGFCYTDPRISKTAKKSFDCQKFCFNKNKCKSECTERIAKRKYKCVCKGCSPPK